VTESRRPVIVARGVSKSYTTHTSKATALKERVVRGRGLGTETFHALNDVSVVVGEGETVGLIGPNGAGKSTLLKILAGILRPTTGSVEVQGRIASLLELGAGFNGELSGRENVYLNAALLGLSRKEVDGLFDSIVAFSEQGDRIDDPVKHYSSGEYVKLAFSIAVHVDPDVLLVDEVLAVGDEAFARKCLAKIREFQEAGRTILFVTHSLDLVTELCTRGVVVDHGTVQYDGDPAFAVGTLRRILGTDRPVGAPEPVPDLGGIQILAATVSDSRGGPQVPTLQAGGPMHLRVELEVEPRTDTPYAGAVHAVVMGAGDIPLWSMKTPADDVVPAVPGRYVADFCVDALPPLNGAYRIGIQVEDPVSGNPVSVRIFDKVFWVTSGDLPGILAVPFASEVHPA
jgi:ABC-2 type transport system ATP-binding protein